MEHIFYTKNDFKESNKLFPTARAVLRGGAKICRKCRLRNETLTTECIGLFSAYSIEGFVKQGSLDFKDGKFLLSKDLLEKYRKHEHEYQYKMYDEKTMDMFYIIKSSGYEVAEFK